MCSKHIEKNNQKPEGAHLYSEEIEMRKTSVRPGLYLVATPIGNLRDISLRALDVLAAADIVFCEDTRVSRKLLNAYNIKVPMKTYNDHSDDTQRDAILSLIEEGQVVALVSDAGMPLISDPGYRLVQECSSRNVYVTSIPGANAPLTAVQLSALPSDCFSFLGFLPTKTAARQKVFSHWADVQTSLVAFESAPRLLSCLKDIHAVLPDREVAVVREISKLYEEVRKDTAHDLIAFYTEQGLPKGEIVLVIAPPVPKEYDSSALENMIRDALKTMKSKDAARDVAQKTGEKVSVLYDIALAVQKEG